MILPVAPRIGKSPPADPRTLPRVHSGGGLQFFGSGRYEENRAQIGHCPAGGAGPPRQDSHRRTSCRRPGQTEGADQGFGYPLGDDEPIPGGAVTSPTHRARTCRHARPLPACEARSNGRIARLGGSSSVRIVRGACKASSRAGPGRRPPCRETEVPLTRQAGLAVGHSAGAPGVPVPKPPKGFWNSPGAPPPACSSAFANRSLWAT